MSPNACRASSRFGGSAPSQRNPVSAFKIVAAIGWFTSWAIEAVSCPIVATRFACATRRFRPLTRLPGAPAVVIAAHPVKRASNDDLLPYGGGSTLNEVDGNLTLAPQQNGLLELGWQGKFRGLGFEPPLYRIDPLMSPEIIDIDGRQVAIPVLRPATAEDAETRESAIANRDAQLMRAVADNPQASLSALADAAGIARSAANRALHRLAKEKPALVRQTLGKWTLAKAGKDALKECPKGGTIVPLLKRNGERNDEP
jgi:IclR helix-turn-helix domain